MATTSERRRDVIPTVVERKYFDMMMFIGQNLLMERGPISVMSE